jgi:hypothetical protein
MHSWLPDQLSFRLGLFSVALMTPFYFTPRSPLRIPFSLVLSCPHSYHCVATKYLSLLVYYPALCFYHNRCNFWCHNWMNVAHKWGIHGLLSFLVLLAHSPAFCESRFFVPPCCLLLLLVLTGGLSLVGEFRLGRLMCFYNCVNLCGLYRSSYLGSRPLLLF